MANTKHAAQAMDGKFRFCPIHEREPDRGPPMTLGAAAAAGVRIIVWWKDAGIRSGPDPTEMATRYGAETSVLDWRERLVCSRCKSRDVDMVVSRGK